jgi:hypothetical protein
MQMRARLAGRAEAGKGCNMLNMLGIYTKRAPASGQHRGVTLSLRPAVAFPLPKWERVLKSITCIVSPLVGETAVVPEMPSGRDGLQRE